MKRNVTISLPEDTYRRARVWAAKRDTTVTAVVCYLVENLPGLPIAREGIPIPAKLARSTSVPRAQAASTVPATSSSSASPDSPARAKDPQRAR
jgi:hypothetical protein